MILPPEPPIQSLMDYIFDNYSDFDDFCEFTEDLEPEPVDVEECVECHKASYYDEGNPIYECTNFKQVYLFRYLATQFVQSDFVIQEHVRHLIDNKTDLSAVSLGGGPAPEALALMNELSSCEGEYNLFFNNIDYEASWEDIYHDVSHQFSNYIQNVKLRTDFSCHDITSYVSEKLYDIVFISWVLSEISEQQDILKVLKVASDLVTPQGCIIIMDSWESKVVENISSLVRKIAELTIQEHDERWTKNCGVQFPDDIREFFKVRLYCDTAYWVLQNSSDEF